MRAFVWTRVGRLLSRGLLWVVCVGLFPVSVTGEPLEVGVAWQGQALMQDRVLAGLKRAIADNAPQIRLEIRKELPDLEALEAVITEFEATKQAMVILRSNGAELLGRRGAAIPAFIGGANNPVELGAAYALDRLKPNITGVTYYLPIRLKLQSFRQIYPDLDRLLLLVEAGHPGSAIDVDETESAAADLGLSVRVVSCLDLDEALSAVRAAEPDESIVLGVQALLIDNVAAIMQAADERIVLSYSEQGVDQGALAAVAADDDYLGRALGMMLIDHLIHGVPVADMPIQTDPDPRVRLNYRTLERFGDRIPLAVRSLARSERKLESILRSAPTGIGVVEDRHLVQVNDYVLELTGYSREELIGQYARMLYPTRADYDYVGTEKYRQLAEQGVGRVETRWRHKDGSVRYVILSSTPIDSDDLDAGVTFTVLDITDWKRAEAALMMRTRWFLTGSAVFIVILLAMVAWLAKSLRQRRAAVKALRKNEERLVEINKVLLNLGPDYEANVSAVTAFCGQLMGATCALYNRLEDGLLCALGQWNTPPDFESQDKPEGHICYDVIKGGNREVVIVRKLPKTSYAQTDPNVTKYGLKTYIGHPVMCRGAAVGSLCVVYQQDVEPTGDEIRALGILSSALGAEEERRQAEKALRESEGKLSALFSAMTELVVLHELVFDDEGQPVDYRITDVNDAFCKVLGVTREKAVGRLATEVYEVPEAPFLHVYARVAQTGQPEHFITHYKPMRKHFAISVVSPEKNKFATITTDITKQKQAEEERLLLERQMLHAQKLESLGVLAGGIAHDFNNLLMTILGNADLALDALSPMSPARDNLKEVERATRRAADLAKQMLAYSGKGRFLIEPIDAGKLVEEMAHLLKVSVSKRIVFKYNFAENLPTFEGDATQIRQVILNLVTNASEAIGDRSGVIALSTGAQYCDRDDLDQVDIMTQVSIEEPLVEGLYVYFEVADTGCGMDAETREKIFDPFFTTKFTGRGLGMSAVLGILRGHKGAIKINSEPGKGTTFQPSVKKAGFAILLPS